MSRKIVALVFLVGIITESTSLIYSHDPSSLKLSCNPYRQDIKLQCTVQEPATLTSPLSLLILWYWSAIEINPTFNGCQLYPNYQCTRYVGHSKYMFEFKRYKGSDNETGEGGRPVMYRTLELTVRNVTSSDRGCYYCRPWINMVLLNESSGVFCVKPESSYNRLAACSKNDVVVTSSVISSEIIWSSTELSSVPISSPMPISSPVVGIVPTNLSDLPSSDKHLGLWLYGCIALCIVLGFTTMLLAIVTMVLGKIYLKQRTGLGNLTSECNAVGYENRIIITPLTAKNQPHFMDTYSFVQEKDIESSLDTLTSEPIKKSEHPTTDTHQTVITDGPGCQIYQTLDKYIEELECHTTQDSYDRLFDDPNYSPLCAPYTSSLLVPPTNPPIADVKYDKLASKPTETSEYAYTYVHVPRKQRNPGHMQTRSATSKEKSEELLRIAALGTYEMDPEFISTLQLPSEEAKSQPSSPPPKVNRKKTRVVEGIHPSNCYQSLDQKTLSPDNSYTTLNTK